MSGFVTSLAHTSFWSTMDCASRVPYCVTLCVCVVYCLVLLVGMLGHCGHLCMPPIAPFITIV